MDDLDHPQRGQEPAREACPDAGPPGDPFQTHDPGHREIPARPVHGAAPTAPVSPGAAARARRHLRRVAVGIGLLCAVLFAAAVAITLLLAGYPVSAPRWVAAEVEARVDDALEGVLQSRIGGVELFIEEGWQPRLRITDLRLSTPTGREAAVIPDLRLVLDRDSLLRGRLRPAQLRLPDVQLFLRRMEDGRFDVDFGGERAAFRAMGSMPEVLGALDELLEAPILDRLEAISADRLRVTLEDAVTGRTWALSDGDLDLRRDAAETRASLVFALAQEGGTRPARADLTFVAQRDSLATRLDAELMGVPAAHIAQQTPALGWLAVLDARVSGRLAMETDAAGELRPATGRLDIGRGRLSPSQGVRPIPFDGARLGFTYLPAEERILFSDIAVDSPAMRFDATGQAFLGDRLGGMPRNVVLQVALTDLVADPDGVFDAPVGFSGGQADLKLRLEPFRLTIGQAALWQGEEQLRLSGRIDGAKDGWAAALDVDINRIGHDRLLALWPTPLVAKTRDWLKENVRAGELFDVRGAVRLEPGQEPRLSLGYEYDTAEVRALATLPPIREGAGRAAIEDTRYTMLVDRGRVEAPQGGSVDVTGSVFAVPDIRQKPARATLDLRAEGPVTAGLSLLDQPPFQFLTKAGKPVDLAEGRAEVRAEVEFPLRPKVKVEDVDYRVTGWLRDIRSDRLVPGRVLTAETLTLRASDERLEIAGAGALDGVGFEGRWSQPLTREGRDLSRLEARVPLSPAAARAFAPGLPAEWLSGGATGDLTVDLPKGEPARFTLTSDLTGLGMALPPLGWAKAPAASGRLAAAGRMGEPPVIDRLALSAPGLTLEGGEVRLAKAGGLADARFDRVRLGGWLDAPVELTGRGRGVAPAVALPGGRIDLRRLSAAAGSGGRGGGGSEEKVPLTLALDRVQVSESLVLTGFTGRLVAGGGGVTGPFRARVNGGPAVEGQVSPAQIRVRGADAGAVMRVAGVTDRAAGGAFDLALTPRGGRRGEYDGQLAIAGLRLYNLPSMANVASAVSLVGLFDQVAGKGLVFDEVTGEFRLTPGAVEIKRASAIGPSLGVTAAGVYLFEGQRMELTGAISPVYLLNGIGSLIAGKGEGLFGFSYAVSGTAGAPRISVNPLSVLAPGPLRKLVQRPAPRLAQ